MSLEETLDKASKVLNAIIDDVREEKVPVVVKSWEDLHNYVDANEYFLVVFPDIREADFPECNRISKIVSGWLKSGVLKREVSEPKCQYVGCKKPARYKVIALYGNNHTLCCCEICAPEWVKGNEESYMQKKHGISSYKVVEIL